MSFQLTGVQALTRVTGLVPANSDYTCLMWVRLLAYPTSGGPSGADTYVNFFTYTNVGYTAWAGSFSGTPALVTQNKLSVSTSDSVTTGNTTGTTISLNVWHQIAYVRQGSNQKFWFDNSFVGSPAVLDLSAQTWTNLIVGYDGFSATEMQVTKFREWNSALTGPQIAAEIASPTAVIAAFTDCPLETDLLDISGNGHHFTNVGGATVVSASGKYLVWTKQAGTGTQAVTGFGFEPKALLLWSSRRIATGPTDGVQISDAMTDGVLQVCRFQCNPDNETTTTSAQTEIPGAMVYQTSATSGATPTVENYATLSSFDADGFTLNWINNDGAADKWHALALGGDGFQCQLDFVQLTGANFSTYNVTGLPFTPASFIALTGVSDTLSGAIIGSPFGTFAGFGYVSQVSTASPLNTGTVTSQGLGGTVGSTTCRAFTQDTYCTQCIANTTLGGDNAINIASSRISAMGGNSYQIQRVGGFVFFEQQSPTPFVYYLAMNITTKAGFFDTPTSPGTVTVPVGFQADMVMAESTGSHHAVAGKMDLSIGAWHADTGNMGCAWVGGANGANPSVMARSTETDAIVKLRTPAATGSSSAVYLQGTVQSVSSTSITFDFTTVPGTTRRVLYMAFGLEAIPPPEPPSPPIFSVTEHPIRRLRRAPHLNNENKRISYPGFELDFQRGIGIPGADPGENPVMMFRISRDGGRTWSSYMNMHAGELGQYKYRATLKRLGMARDAVFEVTTSDPNNFVLTNAWLTPDPKPGDF